MFELPNGDYQENDVQVSPKQLNQFHSMIVDWPDLQPKLKFIQKCIARIVI